MQVDDAHHQHGYFFFEMAACILICRGFDVELAEKLSEDVVEAGDHFSWEIDELEVKLSIEFTQMPAIDVE